ncbi:GlxA family transcriptional regulator [Actinomadura hibisca]|uniref:GlxA family transcriptional regulator n=1 Tax=Actinomadura hibisca TaxID=68565 RepID=UPI00083048CC|nr:DJ-1/PfpI family protein [Actinomadura hibisca]
MPRIAFVAVPPVMLFDLAIAQMVLGAAEIGGAPGYEVLVCAAEPGPVATVDGLSVPAAHGLDAVAGADTVIVIGGGGLTDVDPRVLAAVRDAHAAGKRMAAICTGTFVLAQAEVLDGRRATTHWGLAGDLARRFPAVRVVPDVLYVVDGPVVTSAGAAACVELCLHLIREDHGAAAAAQAARLAVVAPPRPADQAQAVRTPLPAPRTVSLAPTRAWALERLDEPLTLTVLAMHARVSTRTLARRFQDETGQSPLQWLLHQRLDRACELLETTDLPMDQVARRSGLGSADSLRQHLVRRRGLTPSAYRARAKTPSAS